ncbi:YcxB family protein [Phyllobacterium sp. SB3]|uniref:YcxB family protein n=1 Tax=Phyllobacterium sp. SB3 TaxID=3156073 RepID=UPI0032AFFCCF
MRDAVRSFVWQRGIATQKGLWMAEAVLIAFLVWLLWKGEQGWQVGAVGVVVFLPPVFIITMWVAHYRNTVGKFRRMPSHQAEFTFLDEGFEVISELGAGKIPWSGVTEIWERPDYWMIFTAPSQFTTLPVQTITSTDLEFLRSKVPSAPSGKS